MQKGAGFIAAVSRKGAKGRLAKATAAAKAKAQMRLHSTLVFPSDQFSNEYSIVFLIGQCFASMKMIVIAELFVKLHCSPGWDGLYIRWNQIGRPGIVSYGYPDQPGAW